MEFINNWVQGIIVAIIVNTIIEVIIPDGKNKKYIRTIMGIYITFIIISPIITKVTNTEINLNNLIDEYKVENYAIETSIDANKYIENTYIEKIKQDIKEKLLKLGYETTNCEVTIENKDNNNYGEILEISVNLNKAKTLNSKVETIEKVDISLDKKEDLKEVEISEEEKNEIKEYLESVYGTYKENIKING